MFIKIIETISFGITSAVSAVIISIILDFNINTLRNIEIGSFIFDYIRV